MVEVLSDGDDPSGIGIGRLGVKAYRLLELGRWARVAVSFKVPRFVIVPAERSERYFRQHGHPPVERYGLMPEQNAVTVSTASFFEGFYAANGALFERCRDYLPGPRDMYIGSSLALGADRPLSFAGVNSRTTPTSVPRGGNFLELAVQNALSGLYRPYTELYLRGHGIAETVRPASIMFYEFIDAEYEAVAYVFRNSVHVEWKPLRDPHAQPLPRTSFPLDGDAAWDDYWAVNHRGERVRAAVRDILQSAGLESSRDLIVEFEFCFTDDDLLYFLQYRFYPARASPSSAIEGAHIAPILATVGESVGRPVSLLASPVTLTEADRIAALLSGEGAQKAIWFVNRIGPGWDAFRLLWLADYVGLSPIRLVLCHRGEPYPTHVTSVLREDPRVEFFAETDVATSAKWLEQEQLSIESDGILCRSSVRRPAEGTRGA